MIRLATKQPLQLHFNLFEPTIKLRQQLAGSHWPHQEDPSF